MLLFLNHQSGLPVYRQIQQQIRERIASGQLLPDEQMPSVRDLSSQLHVNPLTIAKVYQMLERDGLVEFRRGLGTFVSPRAKVLSQKEQNKLIQPALDQVVREARHLGLTLDQLTQLLTHAYERKP